MKSEASGAVDDRQLMAGLAADICAAVLHGHSVNTGNQGLSGDGKRQVHGLVVESSAVMLDRAIRQDRACQQGGGSVDPLRRLVLR
jgi:hypothetical protein